MTKIESTVHRLAGLAEETETIICEMLDKEKEGGSRGDQMREIVGGKIKNIRALVDELEKLHR